MTSIAVLCLPTKVNDALLQANLDTVEDFLLNAPLDGDHQQEPQSSRSKRKSFTGSILTPAQQTALRALTTQELEAAYDQASAFVCQGINIGTGRDLLQDQCWLSLGDRILDEPLGGGGIMTRSITEIVGESSAGKTQFCLQLCLTVQLPRHLGGLDGSVVWLSTEGKFAYTRLEAMIPSFLAKYKDAGTDLTAESIRDNIYFDAMADQETQLHVFNYQLPILIKETHALAETQEEEEGPTQPTQVSSASMGDANEGELSSYPRGGVRKKPIRLIIVDSITNNFRSELNMRPASEDGMGSLAGQVEGGESSMKASLLQRSADLCETGIRLRTLADQFNLAVVCVNQVSDIFDAEATTTPTGHPTAPLIAESSSSNNHHHHHNNKSQLARHRWSHAMRKLKPALGLIWENTINTRILLERTQPSFLSSSAASALAQLQFPQPPPSADSPPEVHQAFAHQCQLIQEQRERIMARQEPIRVMSVLFSPWTSTESAWCRYSIQQEGVVGVED